MNLMTSISHFVWRLFGRHRKFCTYSIHTDTRGRRNVTEHSRCRLAWQKTERVEERARRIQ